MKRRSAWLAAVCGLVLVGCATPPGTSDIAQQSWSGRLAVQVQSAPPQSLSAGFELNGSPEAGELRLHSPLGTTLAIIRWRPGMAQLQRGGEWTEAHSLSALSEQLLGTDVPVAALFDWLAGRDIEVPGWQADVSRLADGRLSASRQLPLPAADLRLVLDR